jgi:hypothetical protein
MTNSESTSQRGPLYVARNRISLFDLVLLVGVPAVLLWVFDLPVSTRETYVFEYGDPTPLTAFVSTYVHLERPHLLLNLAGYGLVVPIAYLLSVLSDRRNRFLVAFISILLAFPIVLSYLNLTIVRDSASVGFSGVLLALYGYLPQALGDHVERHFDIGASRDLAPLFFLAGIALIVGLTVTSLRKNPVAVPIRGRTVPVTQVLLATLAGLAVAIGVSMLWFGLDALDKPRLLFREVRAAINSPGYFELFLVGLLLFLAVPFATFPVDPIVRGGVLNLYIHLVGYALGFISTYATVQLGRWVFDTPEWL